MATDDEQDEQVPEPKVKRSNGNLVVIICGVAVMIMAPLSSYLVVKMSQPDDSEEKQKPIETPVAPITHGLESLVVNVKDTRMTRVLRLEPHLVLSNASLEPVITELKPVIKDRIMMIASQRTLEELESKEDRDALKRDIANNINELIRDRMQGSVLDVVFSDFLIQ